MWIVAIGWIYVVVLMAVTEPTVVAGIMTFFGYCVLPLSLVLYLASSKRKRAGRAVQREASGLTGTFDDMASRDAGSEPPLQHPASADRAGSRGVGVPDAD
jgi:hypothetical protein